MATPEPRPDSKGAASAEDVEAAWNDTKLAQVLYHDWEAASYDEKWSISYDERCQTYAADRFVAVAGTEGWPYGATLEVGAGTGFFTLNLALVGVLKGPLHVTDLSPGMVEAAERNAAEAGLDVTGAVADAEALPYPDDSFDLVIGHAVIHHIPDVEQAFREMLRVLRPGGRFVICGEPTTIGDRVARTLGRVTWATSTRLTALPGLRGRWARPADDLHASSHAAALEWVVDLHTFDPDDLTRTALRAGAIDVATVTEELTASWFGWPARTLEYAVRPDRLGRRWAQFSYTSWQRLSALDRLLTKVVPDKLFYNVSVMGVKPPQAG
ncbi:MAG: methyltransferase domain-containing protein [Jiangellales bacterium]